MGKKVRKIVRTVTRVKILPEVKQGYMKFEELMAYAEQKGWENGMQKGMQQSILEILQDYGNIPKCLREKMNFILV